jgi:hypothetical protein
LAFIVRILYVCVLIDALGVSLLFKSDVWQNVNEPSDSKQW